ncbi:hypothetical protein [Bartonella sp. HY761]|uniref:hypothetical protein n=1 Tax=Bartonella sp. HY761 TaxID=2979330 RepID=UPI002203AB21|nr:hypothetical protein [Bartonella sp. HY761]UXN05277.1 hypothetical protein N6A79_08065 [Bartonella sp. HY761]
MSTARSENEIFDDLLKLCTSPGYIHALSSISFIDNIIISKDVISPDDIRRFKDSSPLIRSELAILIGQMVKKPLNQALPCPATIKNYIHKSRALIEELHAAINNASLDITKLVDLHKQGKNPFKEGNVLRESILYAHDSAYSFQYEELIKLKYKADDGWLEKNCGFRIDDAILIVKVLSKLIIQKISEMLNSIDISNINSLTYLQIFTFTKQELEEKSSLSSSIIESFLTAFQFDSTKNNDCFKTASDLNQINIQPIIHIGGDSYAVFQHYQLYEALYESPFFWMLQDAKYKNQAESNRGQFTENYISDRLESIFGKNNVLRNINIYQGKNIFAEADTLILYGNCAIVVQAKSKRLTIPARKGDSKILSDDFKKAVQNAYDQSLDCADALINWDAQKLVFKDTKNNAINIPAPIEHIFLICAVSDHYPALNTQSKQFLLPKTDDIIKNPLIIDIFTLDVMAEFLDTPIQFLHYLNQRHASYEKLLINDELVALAFHLKHNLYFEDNLDLVHLRDEFTSEIDAAFMVRRLGLRGNKEIKGLLTKYRNTVLGTILKQLRNQPNAEAIEIAFFILSLSGEAIEDLSQLLKKSIKTAKSKKIMKDVSIPMKDSSCGLTLYIARKVDDKVMNDIREHLTLRKYRDKAECWYGLIFNPYNNTIGQIFREKYPWKFD